MARYRNTQIPIIGANKVTPQKAAMEAFVNLKEDVGIQKVVIQSQARLILELVRKYGVENGTWNTIKELVMATPGSEAYEIRVKKDSLLTLDATWELITQDDEERNEMVLIARKCVDNGGGTP